MSRLVICAAHPGTHLPTPTCVAPRRESTGHRFSRWLERKLNPKQGRPGPACPACGNHLLEVAGRCVYCDGKGLLGGYQPDGVAGPLAPPPRKP